MKGTPKELIKKFPKHLSNKKNQIKIGRISEENSLRNSQSYCWISFQRPADFPKKLPEKFPNKLLDKIQRNSQENEEIAEKILKTITNSFCKGLLIFFN